MLQLYMTIATEVDLGEQEGVQQVGKDVPPCHIYTVELQIKGREQILLNNKTLHVISQLYIGDSSSVKAKATIAP